MLSKTLLSACLLAAAAALAGCATNAPKKDKIGQEQTSKKPAEVVLVGTDTFPKQMVGVWENKQHGWIFRFEQDGRLSKIQHTTGRLQLKAGQRSEFPLIEGGKGFAQPGPWQVEYNALTGDLVVDVSLEEFAFFVKGNQVKGSSRDLFTGKAPAEGETVWRAAWLQFPKYIATTADRQYVDYELPQDEGAEDQGVIEFEKVDLSKLEISH